MNAIVFVVRKIKYTLTKRAWTLQIIQALLLLVLCILVRYQYVRVLPLIAVFFLNMFMTEGEDAAIYKKAHPNLYWNFIFFCLGGSAFLSFVIVNPIIGGLLHLPELLNGLEITPSKLFVFLVLLPPAVLSGLIIAFTISAVQSGNQKSITRIRYWMMVMSLPFLILTVYGWWQSYSESGNLTDVFWDNFLSILFFVLASVLYIYNLYKQRYKNDISVSFFVLQLIQFVFSLLSGLSSVYFLLVREIVNLYE